MIWIFFFIKKMYVKYVDIFLFDIYTRFVHTHLLNYDNLKIQIKKKKKK